MTKNPMLDSGRMLRISTRMTTPHHLQTLLRRKHLQARSPFRKGAESQELATFVDRKRSNVTGKFLAPIVPSIAMVSPSWTCQRNRAQADFGVVECTYDQPSNRRRNPPPQYIEALETRLRRAQALLRKHMPEVNLDDPKLDDMVSEPLDITPKHAPSNARIKEEQKADAPSAENGQMTDHELESMVKTTGSLDLDESGYWDYHGTSSGLVFIRRMREQFGDLMGQAEATASPFIGNSVLFSDSPRSNIESPTTLAPPNTQDLPSKLCALDLCYGTLHEACSILRFVHQPTFYKNLDRIYDLPVDQWGSEENRFLPLLYTVLAVGSLFSHDGRGKLMSDGYGNATDRG